MRFRIIAICFLSTVCFVEIGASASLGPFNLANEDSSSYLRIQFAGQLRLDFRNIDRGAETSAERDLSMQGRRIRPIIRVTLPEQNLSFRLHLSAAPKSLEMMDLYFDYSAHEQVRLRFGQYKVPFTRYRIQSFQRLTFADWPVVTKAFGAERQMGVAVHNGYERPSRYGYAFGVFSGVNARASHAVYLPNIYDKEISNPSDLADPGPRADFHPELVLHLAYNARGIQVQSDTDEMGGGLRYAAMFSAAWDIDPTLHEDFTFRLAPEFLAKYQGMSFCAIAYAGYSEIGEAEDTDLAMLGGLLQTAYRINRRYEISARYAILDLSDALTDDCYLSAQLLSAESECHHLNDANAGAVGSESNHISAASGNGSGVLREEEIGIGLNTYIIGHTLKWQNDASWLSHKRLDGYRTDFIVRSQLQLTF